MTKQEIDAKIAELQELRETAPDSKLRPFDFNNIETKYISYKGEIEDISFNNIPLFQHTEETALIPIQNQLKLISILFKLKIALGDDTGIPDGRSVSYLPIYDLNDRAWLGICCINRLAFGEYFTKENCEKVVEYLNKNCPNWRVE